METVTRPTLIEHRQSCQLFRALREIEGDGAAEGKEADKVLAHTLFFVVALLLQQDSAPAHGL